MERLTKLTVAALLLLGIAFQAEAREVPDQQVKVRLTGVRVTPETFSPGVTKLLIALDFDVKATNGAAGNKQKAKEFFVIVRAVIRDADGNVVQKLEAKAPVIFLPGAKGNTIVSGTVEVSWDGRNANGDLVANGTYTIGVSGAYVTVNVAGNSSVESIVGTTITPPEIEIEFDATPPAISNLLPKNGALTNDPRPKFSAVFKDEETGVISAFTLLTLNGVDIFADATVTDTGFTFTPAADLADGAYTLAVTIFDVAGNSTSAKTSIEIDTISNPPEYDFVGDTFTTESSSVTLTGTVDEDAVTLIVTSQTLAQENITVTLGAANGRISFQIDLQNLPLDITEIEAIALDAAGNFSKPRVISVVRTVPPGEPAPGVLDDVPPVITILEAHPATHDEVDQLFTFPFNDLQRSGKSFPRKLFINKDEQNLFDVKFSVENGLSPIKRTSGRVEVLFCNGPQSGQKAKPDINITGTLPNADEPFIAEFTAADVVLTDLDDGDYLIKIFASDDPPPINGVGQDPNEGMASFVVSLDTKVFDEPPTVQSAISPVRLLPSPSDVVKMEVGDDTLLRSDLFGRWILENPVEVGPSSDTLSATATDLAGNMETVTYSFFVVPVTFIFDDAAEAEGNDVTLFPGDSVFVEAVFKDGFGEVVSSSGVKVFSFPSSGEFVVQGDILVDPEGDISVLLGHFSDETPFEFVEDKSKEVNAPNPDAELAFELAVHVGQITTISPTDPFLIPRTDEESGRLPPIAVELTGDISAATRKGSLTDVLVGSALASSFKFIEGGATGEITVEPIHLPGLRPASFEVQLTGSFQKPRLANFIALRPSTYAAGQTVEMFIGGGNFGEIGGSATVEFSREGGNAGRVFQIVEPPTVVSWDGHNDDMVRAVRMLVNIADERGFDGIPDTDPADTDGPDRAIAEFLGLWDVTVSTGQVQGFVMEQVLNVIKLEFLDIEDRPILTVLPVRASDLDEYSRRLSSATFGTYISVALDGPLTNDQDSIGLTLYGAGTAFGFFELTEDANVQNRFVFEQPAITLDVLSVTGLPSTELGEMEITIDCQECGLDEQEFLLSETSEDSLLYQHLDVQPGTLEDIPVAGVAAFNYRDQPFTQREFRVHLVTDVPQIAQDARLEAGRFSNKDFALEEVAPGEFLSCPVLLVDGEPTAEGNAYLESISPDALKIKANIGFKDDDDLVARLKAIGIPANIALRGKWSIAATEKNVTEDARVPKLTLSTTTTVEEEKALITKYGDLARVPEEDKKKFQFVVARRLVSIAEKDSTRTVKVFWKSSKFKQGGFVGRRFVNTGRFRDYLGLIVKIVSVDKGKVGYHDTLGKAEIKNFKRNPLGGGLGPKGTQLEFDVTVPKDGLVVVRVLLDRDKNFTTTTDQVPVDEDLEIIGLGARIDIPTKVYKVFGKDDVTTTLDTAAIKLRVKEAVDFWKEFGINLKSADAFKVNDLRDTAKNGAHEYTLDQLNRLANIAKGQDFYFIKNAAIGGLEVAGFARSGEFDTAIGQRVGLDTAPHETGHAFGLPDIEHPGLETLLMYHATSPPSSATNILGIEIIQARKGAAELVR